MFGIRGMGNTGTLQAVVGLSAYKPAKYQHLKAATP